jgi:transcriptional regulator with XRE-family HTH domain
MKLHQIRIKPRLSKLLKEKGWTQSELADKTGVNQASISRFDIQTRHDDRHLFVIAHALDCRIEDLFEVVENEDSKQETEE